MGRKPPQERSLFESDDTVNDVLGRAAPRARATFLAGLLAGWVYGDVKLREKERHHLEEIAAVTIRRVEEYKRNTRGDT